MSKLRLIVLIQLLLAVVMTPRIPQAATYFISQGGTGNGSACNDARSMTWANTNLTAGDTAYLCDNGGTFTTAISPANNGSAAGGYITYEEYSGEKAVTNKMIELMGHEYIKVKGIHVNKPDDLFFSMTNSNHCIIDGCTFTQSAAQNGFARSSMRNSTYCQLLNSTYNGDAYNEDKQYDWLHLSGAKNALVYNNNFGKCAHTGIYMENGATNHAPCYVVIWGNTMSNPWRRHFALRQKNSNDYRVVRLLYHGNRQYELGQDPYDNPYTGDRSRISADKWNVEYSIYRFNVSWKNDTNFQFQEQLKAHQRVIYNYIYNNTWYKSTKPARHSTGGVGITGRVQGDILNNKWINNILWEYDGNYDESKEMLFQMRERPGSQIANNTFAHNIFGRTAGSGVVECRGEYVGTAGTCVHVEAGETEFHDNIFDNPEFTDAAHENFTLQPWSPAIDAGTWLTSITSKTADNQTSFTVANANPFFSGPGSPWFIDHPDISGDTIKTENGEETVIQSIDYETNTLTVSPAIDIVKGEGLSLKYNGLAPDIGAYEYESVSINLGAPKRLRIIESSQN